MKLRILTPTEVLLDKDVVHVTAEDATGSLGIRPGHAALVTTTDIYGYSDPWHYDSAGYIDLGKQFAIALHGLRSEPLSSTPDPDPLRFQPDIDAFANWDGKNTFAAD